MKDNTLMGLGSGVEFDMGSRRSVIDCAGKSNGGRQVEGKIIKRSRHPKWGNYIHRA